MGVNSGQEEQNWRMCEGENEAKRNREEDGKAEEH
jgi:hypothetical protein